ncbi:hypothetical protein N9N67_07850 [Bacteriovoracaceae bacterium]|nr:hypothetical protein [Bacteriovoracaceae bacterium]
MKKELNINLLFIIFLLLSFFPKQIYSQGSPGPIPPTGPYPIASGIVSVMEQDVWLQPITTIDQQTNAVTQDALQIHQVVLPPLPSGGDPNVYTDPSTPLVSASPGPTSSSSGSSSSSTTTSSSSSSGSFPGSSNDHLIWISDTNFTTATLTDAGGSANMRTITDGHCVTTATSMGWPNAANAKGLLGAPDQGCKRLFSGGSGVYTPASGGTFNLLNPTDWVDFMDTGPAPNHIRNKSGNIVSSNFITACHRGDYTQSFSCNDWTGGGYIGISTPGNTNINIDFIQKPPAITCATPGAYYIYCGMKWGSSSSSSSSSTTSTTSSSSSTSSGTSPAMGDHVLWIAGANHNSSSFAGSGDVAGADAQCEAEAMASGWSGTTTAKALISKGSLDCRRGFSGGAKVWQMNSGVGWESIYNGGWDMFFNMGPTSPATRDRFGNHLSSKRLIVGCNNSGYHLGHPNNNSANWEGTTSYTSIQQATNWFITQSASFNSHSGMSYYCALQWGGTSSSSSTTSTSNGFPGAGDYIMWGRHTPSNLGGIISQGGVTKMDNMCKTDASNSLYWGNFSSAKALVSGVGHNCTRGFSGSGMIWTPNQYGMFTQVAGSPTLLWPNGPNTGLGDMGGAGANDFASGCGNDANTMSNCINWTDSTGGSNHMRGGTGTGANYMHSYSSTCAASSTIKWMCMMPYTGTNY